MIYLQKHISGDLVYYTDTDIDSLGGLKHIFTTRLGGVSEGALSSLNMGVSREVSHDKILENYRRACAVIGADPSRCVLSKQTHTTNIRIVTEADAGKGLTKNSDIEDTDGLVTNIKNLPIVIFYADCVPILLYDNIKKVVAAVHAGWRGTVNKIAENAVNIMKDTFGCRPSDISAVIGPSICPKHFETGLQVAEEFVNFKEFIMYNNDKAYIDLWQVNRKILSDCGVDKINIANLCTVCNTDIFFSHRGCGSDTGRMALIAYLT